MIYTKNDLGDYVERLLLAQNIEEAFSIFDAEAKKLGYEGVLYSFIPRVLLDASLPHSPVFLASNSYNPDYLECYVNTRLDLYDPLIKAINKGVLDPIDWWGDICCHYRAIDKKNDSVITSARSHGITNGITIPTLSGTKGISCASFVTQEKTYFSKMKQESLNAISQCTSLFHNMVMASSGNMGHFIKPIIESLNATEKKLLVGLVNGKSPSEVAFELEKKGKYIENVVTQVRNKIYGLPNDNRPIVNRNQLLYYAGLHEILDQID